MNALLQESGDALLLETGGYLLLETDVSYVDTKAAIVVHCLAAGLTLTDPILDVQAALPIPKGRCIRVYYGGETEPARIGLGGGHVYTLNSEVVGEVTFIAAFLPISLNDEELTSVVDADLYTLKHEIRTRLLGDSQLGGASTDLELDYVTPDVVTIGNTRYLVGIWRVVSDFSEYTVAE
jgi:hypothetical protein